VYPAKINTIFVVIVTAILNEIRTATGPNLKRPQKRKRAYLNRLSPNYRDWIELS
jgi:hypothetical protein